MKLNLGIEDCNERVQVPLVERPDELSNWVSHA